jgi:hypothetical protein
VPLFLLGVPVLVYGFAQADRLVCAEREFYPDEWERDGFPASFFGWIIPFFSGDRSVLRARTPVPWRWKFRTPTWVATSPEYRRWLRRYRLCIVIWNIPIIVVLGIMLFPLIHCTV